ncbi:hypothetical protein AGABI2DRAFT_180378 [Agaricus bisporus var. bisporus H97]|uniref:hypothetical protein n=1 Tax=Agaricus bisporus var. bisporus (strain H97 / ATCC MYA-4626 / FGSC 10389) TaxID=936046 RepID=UPI00029F5B29|nr:hypothetical protein AGABI2DRAFT_180378 [Agaricus bisporus var. bisporus H97]EKV43959.1 hypothetical protein AGABI2DRAFT_180378 [Agaricus bisporus var. bisporus H97]
MQWLFRSNIPRHRRSLLGPDLQKRNLFGMGEILSVFASPRETLRSLNESKVLLAEARQEIEEQQREHIHTYPRHTFSRLPGFFPRKAEMQTIERCLSEPSFTILFGASSVGKTALLREVLSQSQYHVLHFDLRISGFADLSSLYTSLSSQMEQYFEEIASQMEGYEDFRNDAWRFKYDRAKVENRLVDPNDPRTRIRTGDVARLMELFQNSLVKYWEFIPSGERARSPESHKQNSEITSDATRIDLQHASTTPKRKKRLFGRWRVKRKAAERTTPVEEPKPKVKPVKRMPVIFFDEAHKLPSLIQSTDTMKCLLDSMLVLTKQDRLCHVIHATSDPFYQTWLRQFNVIQHCKIITIGNCTKAETRAFFRDHLIPRVPERIRGRLEFEALYEAFGGKLAHWNDFISDFINSNGQLDIQSSSHFLQAHALLNLHIIHSSQAATGGPPDSTANESGHARGLSADRTDRAMPSHTSGSIHESLHPNLGPAGFKMYSPVSTSLGPDPYMDILSNNDRSVAMVAGYYSADFTAMQLLKVMSRLTKPETPYLPYFMLCRELGVRAVDGMVKGRVLDLRWTEPVSKENGEEERIRYSGGGIPQTPVPMNYNAAMAASRSGTAVDHLGPPPPIDEEEVMTPAPETGSRRDVNSGVPMPAYEDEYLELVGPKLIAISPIMWYAMGEVIEEYEDDQSASEYASLPDVDEY